MSESKIDPRPIHETIEDINDSIDLQLQGKLHYIPIWCGRPGIGKSSIIKQIAQKRDMSLYYVTGAKPLEYWTGLPITNTLSMDTLKKGESPHTVWTLPELIHNVNTLAKEKNVLVFLDDIQVLDKACQRHFFEFALERALHGNPLAKNVAIVGAANHSVESGNEGFYAAINNRFQWMYVKMDWDFWYQNIGCTINRFIATFMKTNPEHREGEESIDQPFATYRSWTELAMLLDQKMSHPGAFERIEEISYKLATGFVSSEAALALRKSVAVQKRFDFEQMFKTGNYQVRANDNVDQTIFSSIVRYIDKDETAKSFQKFLIDHSRDKGYQNLISACMLEMKIIKEASDRTSKRREILSNMIANLLKEESVREVMVDVLL